MNNEISEIIFKTLNGDATLAERKMLIEWLEESVENAEIFGQSEALWLASGILKNQDGYDYQSAYAEFIEKTEDLDS